MFNAFPDGVANFDLYDLKRAVPGIDVESNIPASNVQADLRNLVKSACRLAHFGKLSQVFGFAPGSPDWATAVQRLSGEHSQRTTTLDGYDLRPRKPYPEAMDADSGWGLLPVIIPYNPDIQTRDYATHPLPPIPTICHPDKTYPALGEGFDTVLIPGGSGGAISNPPPSSNIVPLPRRERGVLAMGSSALLTIGNDGPVTLDLQGSIEVDLSACGVNSCTATMSSLVVHSAPFTAAGQQVQVMRIFASNAATGTLQGDSLAFNAFSGTAEVKLADGRYDYLPISSGALLARWDVPTKTFVMALAFSASVEGTDVSLTGTVLGDIDNTSPVATAVLVRPSSTQAGSSATIECQSPNGSSATVSGATSMDLEDGMPKFAWHIGDGVPASTTELEVTGLMDGDTRDIHLMAYDSSGFAGDDRLQIAVVDTTAPQLTSQSIECVWPPNSRKVLLRLGHELLLGAQDACEGDVSDTIEIVDVQSSTGDGVVRWSGTEACVEAERSGNGGAKEYRIRIHAQDIHGNENEHTVVVSVPHNGPAQQCTKPQNMVSCE